MVNPELALGGTIIGVIGTGFLFSASVNFWRRWRAGQRAKQVESASTNLHNTNIFLIDENSDSV